MQIKFCHSHRVRSEALVVFAELIFLWYILMIDVYLQMDNGGWFMAQ